VRAAVTDWAAAWSSKNLNDYFAAYASEFTPAGGMSRQSWEAERRSRILGKSSISVKIEQLQVTVKGNTAVAKFRQAYNADKLNVSSHKTLEFVKAGNRWLIARESSG
jgi:ketosteroid isomerase-like protein